MLEISFKILQTDNPMLPFLSDVLENVMCRLLRMFIKSKIVKDAVTAYNLTKFDYSECTDNQVSLEKVCYP